MSHISIFVGFGTLDKIIVFPKSFQFSAVIVDLNPLTILIAIFKFTLEVMSRIEDLSVSLQSPSGKAFATPLSFTNHAIFKVYLYPEPL